MVKKPNTKNPSYRFDTALVATKFLQQVTVLSLILQILTCTNALYIQQALDLCSSRTRNGTARLLHLLLL
jgi:hypothetical protein